ELYPGQLTLLMGPSGSGKSTLLAVLSGLLRPDAGKAIALEQDLWQMPEREREEFRRKYCGFIFQGYNLFPALTAQQQLEMVLRWGQNETSAAARKRSDEMLNLLGLSKKARLRPHQLSGGEKQRVAIGRALIKNPAFVFADEPTAALDWDNGQQVIRLLSENARQRGAMVLVVTHDPRLMPHADRAFELDDGQLTHERVPAKPHSRTHSLAHDHPHPPSPPSHKKGPRVHLQLPQAARA